MRRGWTGYAFVLPNMLFVLAFVIYPLAYNLVLSLQHWRLEGITFAGLDNYTRMARDPVFWLALRNNVYYALGAVPVTVLMALGLAVALNQKLPIRGVLRTGFLIPHLISWAVVGLIWRWLFSGAYGILNTFLIDLGLKPQGWLLDPYFALPVVVLAGIWANVGFHAVILLAGLQSVPEMYYDAARVDGATAWQRFRYVTLPLLQPILLLVLILATMQSFRVFEQIYVMTGGGPGRATFVLLLYIYLTGFENFDPGYASAISVGLFAVMLLITLAQMRLLRQQTA